jgi:hypothetical protein
MGVMSNKNIRAVAAAYAMVKKDMTVMGDIPKLLGEPSRTRVLVASVVG